MSKIIVLIPVKNEEWILKQFLTITSLFADAIIVADQQSTDASKSICAEFTKVTLIENNSAEYNEAARQILLIEAARRIFPDEKRIFFCLDADEILSADSLNNKAAWETIRHADPGTAFYFEKPDLLAGLTRCVRWHDNYFAVAFVDDNSQHKPKQIHSLRIPFDPETGRKVLIDSIKFMHFALTRKNVLSSRFRYYSAVENIKGTSPFHQRRKNYKSFFSESNQIATKNVEPMPQEWIEGYSEMNINLRNLPDPEFSWYDFEVLRFFKEHGVRRFQWDNIWGFDWEQCRQKAIASGMNDIETKKVQKPSLLVNTAGKIFDTFYALYVSAKSKLQ